MSERRERESIENERWFVGKIPRSDTDGKCDNVTETSDTHNRKDK